MYQKFGGGEVIAFHRPWAMKTFTRMGVRFLSSCLFRLKTYKNQISVVNLKILVSPALTLSLKFTMTKLSLTCQALTPDKSPAASGE